MRIATALVCLVLLTCSSVVSQSGDDLKVVASPFFGLSATPSGDGYRVNMNVLAPGAGWGATVDSCDVNTKAVRIDVRLSMKAPEKPGALEPTSMPITFDTGKLDEGAWAVLVSWRVGDGNYAPRAVLVLRIAHGRVELHPGFSQLHPTGGGKLEVTVRSLTGTYEFDKFDKRDDNADLRVHFENKGSDGTRHRGPQQTREELKPGKLGKGWALLRVYSHEEGADRDTSELLQCALIVTEAPKPLAGKATGVPAPQTGFSTGTGKQAVRASVIMKTDLSQLIPAMTTLKMDSETLEFSLPLRQQTGANAFKHVETRVSHTACLVEVVLGPDAEANSEVNAPIGLLLEGEYQLALWTREGEDDRLLDCIMLKARNNETPQQTGEGVVGLDPYPATWAMIADELRMGRPTVALSAGANGFMCEVTLSVNGAEEIRLDRVEREPGTGLIRIHLETLKKAGGNTGVSAPSTCKVDLGEITAGWHRVELIRPTSGTSVKYGFGIHAE